MTKQKRPYGTWPSQFSPRMVGGKQRRFGHMQTAGAYIYWSESRPEEAGRKALMAWSADEGRVELTSKDFSAASRVHEYGGGEFVVSGNQVFFVNGSDQDIYHISDGKIERLTSAENMRFADLSFDPFRQRLLAVCEIHDENCHLPEHKIVAVSLTKNRGALVTLFAGDDFYASPAVSPCGGFISYISWSRPYMPWEASQLSVSSVNADGMPGGVVSVLGGNESAIFQPIWQGEDLYFVNEQGKWNNIACVSRRDGFKTIKIIWPCAADFGRPQWVFGARSFCFTAKNEITASYMDAGESKLAVFDLDTQQATEIDTPFVSVEMIAPLAGKIVAIATSDERPETLVTFAKGPRVTHFETVRRSADEDFENADISIAKLFSFPTRDGDTAFGLYYPPQNSGYEAEGSEKPPMIVSAHGGPTGRADRGLKLKIQYWTSRGFAFFDVDYRGSSGYGRLYREALDGQWGVMDVCDVIDGALWCAQEGLADGDRLIISGSSAGGLTVLNALAHHDVFKAGACYYAVSDLQALCDETHKFEIDYIYRLTGTTPENARETFAQRSPKHHIADISAPVIFFQGAGDRIVPPAQSRRMVQDLKAQGYITAYQEFAAEGHGFRQEDTIKTALSQEYLFYGTVLGFEAYFEAGEKPPLEVMNFDHTSKV